MTRPTVLVSRRLPMAIEASLADRFDVTFNDGDRPLARNTLRSALLQFDALVPTITDRIDADLIATPGRRTHILANFGAGVDHIDLLAARAAGIVVTNTPDALTDATAELAILLILMASRRAVEGEREVRSGIWSGWRPTHLVGQGVAGRTLGLVGFGRIAQATAFKARALGMTIAFVSRSVPPESAIAPLAARRVETLIELAREVDVLSLHVPGGPATYHLINRDVLAAMKPAAILINTARGPVIDEAALVDALTHQQLAAAALDVYEHEPAVHPLLIDHPRSVLLPHLGSATIEARTAMGMQVIENLEAFFKDVALPNRVG